MFRITVAIGDGPNSQWAFHFNTEESARRGYDAFISHPKSPFFLIGDDYGQSALFNSDLIRGMNIQDMDKMGDGNNAVRLSQAKSELRFQELVEKDTDPLVKRAVQQQKQAERMRQFQGGAVMGGNMPM